MKKTVLVVALVIIATSSFLSACSKDNERESKLGTGIFSVFEEGEGGSDRFASVLSKIEDWVSDGEIVGAEMLIIENRNIIVHESYGWMDREEGKPMEKDTIFRIRSMTKPFIATSILMLAEEGKLDLSDRVSKHLPSFSGEASSSVTIEHLLTHTGGFEQPGFPRDYETYDSLREAVDHIGAYGPKYPPRD